MSRDSISVGMESAASGNSNNIHFLTFNQDASRLAVGTTAGSQTYSTDPVELVHNKTGEGTSIVEMLFSSHLVAHVGLGEGAASSQRCLRMINANTENLILQLHYRSAILAIKMNRERLVCVLDTSIYIHDISNMHTLHTIDPTPRNPKGICALSCHPEGTEAAGVSSYLAFPASDTSGEVYVFDVVNLKMVSPIEAHDSPLSCLAFTPSGDKLATASSKGTVIRVFDPTNGTKLFELRRGLQTSAQIFSMAFNDQGTLLCVSSDKPTVHVFKLVPDGTSSADGSGADGHHEKSDNNNSSGSGSGSGNDSSSGGGVLDFISNTFHTAASSAAGLLPHQMTEIWSGQRNFAQAALPSNCYGKRNVCGIRRVSSSSTVTSGGAERATTGTPSHWQILVATFDGYMFKYLLPDEGGECTLDKTHPLETDIAKKKPSSTKTLASKPAKKGSSSSLQQQAQDDNQPEPDQEEEPEK